MAETEKKYFIDSSGQRLRMPAFTVYDMESTFISLDKAFEYVGDNSSYQKRAIKLLSFQWVFYSFLTMGMPFFFQAPSFLCSKVLDGETVFVPCDENEACKKFNASIFNNDDYNSLSKEFNLYCDKRYLLGLSGSLFFIGSSIAGVIFPYLADSYGRKKTLVFSVGIGSLSVFISGFVWSIYLFMLLIFIAGLCLNGYETICLVYVTEISGKRFRNFSGVILSAVWAGAQIFFSPIAFFVTDWRYLISGIIGLPLLVSNIFTIFFLDESPRYLVTHHYSLQARKVLNKIAVYNCRPPFQFHLYEEMDEFSSMATTFAKKGISHQKYLENKANENKGKFKLFYGYFDLFRLKKYRYHTIMMLYIWFFRYYIYYGIQFSLEDLGTELHVNMLFVALGETLAAILGAPIKIKVKRRSSFNASLMVMTICCFALWFIEVPKDCIQQNEICKEKIINLFLTTMVRFGITLYAVILVTYTSEIYPTSMRSKAYGLCMTVGRTGCIVVPIYVSYMQISSRNNPLMYSGFWCLIALVFTNLLPETEDDILDYVEDSPKVSLLKKDNETENEVEMVKLKKNATNDDFN